MTKFRRMIVRAVPTCTLWEPDFIHFYTWEFKFWPKWKVTLLELVEAG